MSISELNSDTEGVISFIRGNNNLLENINSKGIKVGLYIKFDFDESKVNDYVVVVDDNEIAITSEMANNIFIRV